MASSHLPEQAAVDFADRQPLRPVLELDDHLAGQVAADRGDVFGVDDGRAVDRPEPGRIELVAQLLERLADQGLAAGMAQTSA